MQESMSATLAVCQGILLRTADLTYSLHKATSTFTSHVSVSASLQVVPTNPSKHLLLLRIYKARYLQHIVKTMFERIP